MNPARNPARNLMSEQRTGAGSLLLLQSHVQGLSGVHKGFPRAQKDHFALSL